MKDFTKNEITKMIEERIQGDKRFEETELICSYNCYYIKNIMLDPKTLSEYKKTLDMRCQAKTIEEENCFKGSVAGYTKAIQLMNREDAYLHMDLHDNSLNLIAGYEKKMTDLYRDKEFAKQLGAELLMPEFDNILNIMERDKNKEKENKEI